MRSEGFSFNSGGLGVEPCSRLVVLAFATLSTVRNRSQWDAMARTLGEVFGEGFGWKHDVSDSCEIARKGVDIFEMLKCGG